VRQRLRELGGGGGEMIWGWAQLGSTFHDGPGRAMYAIRFEGGPAQPIEGEEIYLTGLVLTSAGPIAIPRLRNKLGRDFFEGRGR